MEMVYFIFISIAQYPKYHNFPLGCHNGPTFCVLSQLCVHELPLPLAETFLCFLYVTFLQVWQQNCLMNTNPRSASLTRDAKCVTCILMCETHTLRDHKRDLLVIKAIHVAGVFTLELQGVGEHSSQRNIFECPTRAWLVCLFPPGIYYPLFHVSRCVSLTSSKTPQLGLQWL